MGSEPVNRVTTSDTGPRVLIIGAGFSGLAAASALDGAPVRTTIIDRNNYNTFQPLLYQVATAGLNPGDVAYPVRSYVRHHEHLRFRQGTVNGVDLDSRRVALEDGSELEYDYLIIATGATTNYFGVPGASDHGRAIYTLEDAVAVRDRIFAQLEHASAFGCSEGELTIVIVGGGPTGVEMAGTLAELRSMALETSYPELDPSTARVVLVERLDRLLTGFDEHLSRYASMSLAQRGVEVRLGETVKRIDENEVVLESGNSISCGLVIWAAGIATNELAQRLEVPRASGGRVLVGADLRVPTRSEVFVTGDAAATAQGDALLAQLAQPAIQTGRHAGLQVRRLVEGGPTAAFHYRDKGVMATIGRRSAVAQLPGGIRLRGTVAWLAWLGLHVFTLIGFRNRLSVLLNWSWRYVSWRRGPRVIVGG